MPSHKVLKSVCHNFGHSFISLMNYINNDYFLGHLLREARKTRINCLQVDILYTKATPGKLITKSIGYSIESWCKRFPGIVESSGSSMDFIKSAMMIITFDLEVTRQYANDTKITENPFKCEITITDDHNKQYTYVHTGWWYPEA